MFDSWLGKRAATYRRINHIPDDWGTACNVQQMVFGNKGDTSCSGVAFSRDEVTGAPEPSGDFLVNAQGEDVVSGVRNPSDLSEMAERMPEAHGELMEILQTLEAHYKDMQDTEFTVEEGALYMLQTRNAKRPAQAAVRFAVDAVSEELLTRAEALDTIDAASLDALLHPTFAPGADFDRARQGRRRLAGRREGADRVHARRRRRLGPARPHGGARAPVHRGRRRARLLRRAGHPHRRGRQGVARRARRARDGQAVRGRRPGAARSTSRPRTLRAGDTELSEGDLIAIDGSTGEVTADDVELSEPEVDANFETVLGWADEVRRLGVRANADTPEDARKAREFGAEGIGLCRTEHMFMAADRQPKMQAMIMGESGDDRRAALAELLPLQTEDFEGLFEAMHGLPVTIRLLDPPLHEFLPNSEDLAVELERARHERPRDVRRLERTLDRVHSLEETNPMLGTRGARLGIIAPEIYDVQVEAIVTAGRAVRERTGKAPQIEIMLPLVAYEQEVAILRARVEHVIAEMDAEDLRPTIGTMIELPRACFIADRIARESDFFSFGTNDLTQTSLGLSRDDVESGFLTHYLEQRILDRSPFETIDRPGVGWLVRLGAWVGPRGEAVAQARHLRRARRRPRLDRVLPHGRARLRVVLALPRADRARRGGPGGHPRRAVGLGRRRDVAQRHGDVARGARAAHDPQRDPVARLVAGDRVREVGGRADLPVVDRGDRRALEPRPGPPGSRASPRRRPRRAWPCGLAPRATRGPRCRGR